MTTWFSNPAIRYVKKKGAIPDYLETIFASYEKYSRIGQEDLELCLDRAIDNDGFSCWLCSEIFSFESESYYDSAAAYHWAKESAKNNYALGYFQVGFFEENRVTGKFDDVKVLQNYERAVQEGYGFSALRLAEVYQKGLLGQKKDYSRSLELAELAYKLGEITASEYLYQSYSEREPSSYDLLLRWSEASSLNGCPVASMRLSRVYINGEWGVDVNKERAKYYTKLFNMQMDEVERE